MGQTSRQPFNKVGVWGVPRREQGTVGARMAPGPLSWSQQALRVSTASAASPSGSGQSCWLVLGLEWSAVEDAGV